VWGKKFLISMTDHFKRFIKLLNEHNIKYIILGGQAVNYWGYLRYTGDLDIIVEPTRENAENLILALLYFGYEVYDFQVENFTTPNTTVQIGAAPDRIDILSSTLGINFETCFENREEVEIDNIKYNFINLDHLIKNKQAVGRPKDLEDIENLLNKKGGNPKI
jgi:predicted nucleotidyltransferase